MSLPIIHVEIDFANGPSFGLPLILDDFSTPLDVGILADSPSDVVDVTDMVMRVSTRRGRNRILSNFEAGSATVVINDPDSDFNPQNPSSPYYGKLVPLRKIRIYATRDVGLDTFTYNIFSGYITSYDTSFYQGVDSTSTVTLQCVDAFRLLANVSTDLPPVPGCTAGQLSGARIQSLLDYADFPNSQRNIDPGESTMQADPGGQRSILQAIQTVELSEFGAFWVDPSGIATFLDRNTVTQYSDYNPKEFSDDGTQLPYVMVDFAYDDQLILNDVTVTRLGGTPQIVLDQPSIDKYFYKSGQRNDILVETDAEALDQARTLVAARKETDIRIDSMTLNLKLDDSSMLVAALTMDIYTVLNITKTMPGGSSITKELFCQGISHDINANTWNMTIFTAEPIIQGFIVGSPTQGILDTNILTY